MSTIMVQQKARPIERAFIKKTTYRRVKNGGKHKTTLPTYHTTCIYCGEKFSDENKNEALLNKNRNRFMREHLDICSKKNNMYRYV